jgi:serine/threonine-protein kinase HipA
VSFEGALRLVTDACGEADGREMARRVGFMIASGNSDAHLKNWSLQWGDKARPSLSPCYDLVCTIVWDKQGWKRRHGPELALRLGGERLFRALREDALDACARAVGMTWVKDEIINGIKRARDAWPGIAEGAPTRMHDALAEHWTNVPILAQIGPLLR